MTQEEKQLLLKDLCARLPYWVYVDAYSWQKDTPKLLIECVPEYVGEEIVVKKLAGRHSIREIKPYLRPMSSMTEEEETLFRCELPAIAKTDAQLVAMRMELFLKGHLDFNHLIEKGLALEAPEDMYNSTNIE